MTTFEWIVVSEIAILGWVINENLRLLVRSVHEIKEVVDKSDLTQKLDLIESHTEEIQHNTWENTDAGRRWKAELD